MLGKKKIKAVEEKVLDVDAGMQGNLTFRDPVKLRINGKFEGHLETRGNLIIGASAVVAADVIGEDIEINGQVKGDISAKRELRLSARSFVNGNINTPSLIIERGAIFNGTVVMHHSERQSKDVMNIDEVAAYLEVEASEVRVWAESGKLPAFKEDNAWRFNKQEVDNWVTSEKV